MYTGTKVKFVLNEFMYVETLVSEGYCIHKLEQNAFDWGLCTTEITKVKYSKVKYSIVNKKKNKILRWRCFVNNFFKRFLEVQHGRIKNT